VSEEPIQKDKIQSVLTALPLLMVIIGVSYYYYSEGKQSDGVMIMEESRQVTGKVEGVSKIKALSGRGGKFFFWFETEGEKRGARVSQENSEILKELQTGDSVDIWLAPRVAGSKTMWAYQVQHNGLDLLADTVSNSD